MADRKADKNDVQKRKNEKVDALALLFLAWEVGVLTRLGDDLAKIKSGTITDAEIDRLARQQAQRAKLDLEAVTLYLISVSGNMYAEHLADIDAQNADLFKYRGAVPETALAEKIAENYANDASTAIYEAFTEKRLVMFTAKGKWETLDKAFADTMHQATDALVGGEKAFYSAMRDAVRTIGGSGIRVDYGGGITRSVDSIVRQSLLYHAKQAGMAYQDRIAEQLDCDGIEIDYHSAPRPSHEFMQGKQYHIGGEIVIDGVRYEDATEPLERLEDYNCYHYKTPIICGVSAPKYDASELARLKAEDARLIEFDGEQKTPYEWTQEQRQIESAVRLGKMVREMAMAEGDNALAKEVTQNISALMARYDKLSEAIGLAKSPIRMRVTVAQSPTP